MDDQPDISIDEIRLWTVSALKDFLRSRNLKVSGRKDELVALVYAAKIMPAIAPPATSSAEAAAEKMEQYEDLLKTPSGNLPDPRTLANWESEEKAVQKWPPTMAFDIGNYLGSIDNIDLRTRLLADYKDQKAYSYFASGWMGEVEYHEINPQSDYCVLRADCTPSQRIRNIPWKVWVAIEKKSGKIHNAFCTCFAGFSSSCNHVAALLFKVDFAWRHGLNNPACTSISCEWSAFSGRRAVELKRICDLVWSKPQFSKQGSSQDTEGINPRARQLFSPLGARSTSNPTSVATLTQALIPHFEDAAVFQCIDVQSSQVAQSHADIFADVNVDHEEGVIATSVPVPLTVLASNAASLQEFIETMPNYSSKEVSDLEEATRGQATNEEWMNHRRGRVTGSVAHAVLTKQRSRDRSVEKVHVNTSSLVKRILGHETIDSSLPAIKYGREMEEEARRTYIMEHRTNHRHLEVQECGLFVVGDKVYLGASPDGIIKCSCFDTGVLEIKCPHSIAHTKPSEDNLSYLTSGDGAGVLGLKKSHPYYTQVQHQMGVTGTRWCHFFEYTRQGHVTIKVDFDKERWDEVVERSKCFFNECIAKEMVEKELVGQMGH